MRRAAASLGAVAWLACAPQAREDVADARATRAAAAAGGPVEHAQADEPLQRAQAGRPVEHAQEQAGRARAGSGPTQPAEPGPGTVSESVPAAPRRWSAPHLQHELAALADGAIVGRDGRYPETIVAVDARTGAERWRVAASEATQWLSATPGAGFVALQGRADRIPRIGVVDAVSGRWRWQRAFDGRGRWIVGADGSGLGLVDGCALTVIDPADGRELWTLHGRSARLGHHVEPPGASSFEDLCTQPPTLLGQAGACALVLAPEGVADAVVAAYGPEGPCWSIALGRAESRPTVDPASGALWWHDHATLQVARLDRAAGRLRWRVQFAADGCVPYAQPAPRADGGAAVLVHRCDLAIALEPGRGRELWRRAVAADALAVVGEASPATPRLQPAAGGRQLQVLTSGGALAGRITVGPWATARVLADGLLVDDAAGLALWGGDGRLRWRHATTGGQVTALVDRVFVRGSQPATTVILAAKTGAIVGRDPVGAEPLAVLPADGGAPALAVLRAGSLWALELR